MQLGITLSSLALGALGEPAVSSVLEAALRQRRRTGRRAVVSVGLAFVIISILHVVIGEIVPKSYTLPRAEQVALAVSRPDAACSSSSSAGSSRSSTGSRSS